MEKALFLILSSFIFGQVFASDSLIIQVVKAHRELYVDPKGELTTEKKGSSVTLMEARRLNESGKPTGRTHTLNLQCEAAFGQALIDESSNPFTKEKNIPAFIPGRKSYSFGGIAIFKEGHCRTLRSLLENKTNSFNGEKPNCELYIKLDKNRSIEWLRTCYDLTEFGIQDGSYITERDANGRCSQVVGFFGQQRPNKIARVSCGGFQNVFGDSKPKGKN